MPVNTIEEASALIEKWMDRRYPRKDIAASDLDNFRYASETALGIRFSVHQPKDNVDFVAMRARIVIDPEHLTRFESLEREKRDEFIWNLKEKLLFWPTHFQFEDPNSPKAIQFYAEISFDELTAGKLQDTLNKITRPLLWVAWSIGREFGTPQSGE
jgi:hypothetical protein